MTAPSRAESPDALREAMERAKAYLSVGFGPIQADLRLILQAAEARGEAQEAAEFLLALALACCERAERDANYNAKTAAFWQREHIKIVRAALSEPSQDGASPNQEQSQ